MPFAASAFHRLLEPLGRREQNRIVAAHDGNHGVGSGPRAWTCQRHLKAMLFAQLTGLNSLREIEHGLAAQPGGLYHLDLRPAKRSTLGDALKHRPVAVFRDVCQMLLAQASRSLRQQGVEFIQLVDSSPIPLRDPRFGWAEADNRVRGLKLHVSLDPRSDTLDWVEITSPKLSDVTTAREHLPITPDATYVFDKGYADYGWWYQLHRQGAVFVTRLKQNAKRREVTPRDIAGERILEDNDVRIGHPRPRGGAINLLHDVPLREILVERDGKKPMRLITNDLTSPATLIADLYKERWQVELFFKWIKQNLKVKRYIGRSENAVKIQIYAALIAFLLIRLFRSTQALAMHSPKALVARIKVAIFDPFDITNRSKPPPLQPAMQPPSPQLSFKLTGI